MSLTKHFLKYAILVILLQVLSVCVFAQNSDTLTLAIQLNNNKQFKKSGKLLKQYCFNHPDNLNAQWLYAQTEYWAKHFRAFNSAYTQTIKQFPANYYLKLDYALKLVENGEIKKAIPLLEIYKTYDSTSTNLKLALAKIEFWQGNYNTALQTLQSKSFEKEKNIESKQLIQEILVAKSTWLKIHSNYLSDDQPLQIVSPTIEAGTFIHPLLSPYVSAVAPTYIYDSNTEFSQSIKIGNKLNFINTGIAVNMNCGFVQLPNKTNSWTGTVDITKTSFNYFQVQAQASHQPYLVTLASISNSVIPYNFSFSVGWNNLNSWYGKLTSSSNEFTEDGNYIYSISGWLFAPPIKLSSLQFRIGYAYSYGKSKENQFISKLSLIDIIANYKSDSIIKGIYNPYFTPDNQRVHSALINITFNPHKHILLGANANISLIGTTNNPYLYLDKNTNGETFINKDYSKIDFYPYEFAAYILYQITNKITLKADYTFLQNNFYISHAAGLTFKINFWNEKQKQ